MTGMDLLKTAGVAASSILSIWGVIRLWESLGRHVRKKRSEPFEEIAGRLERMERTLQVLDANLLAQEDALAGVQWQFLNRFFTGRFAGSFAAGEPFQLNPTTGDCRICGTMASLAGLEQAEKTGNEEWRFMAVERMKMMYAVLFALPGIPLLYAGDEKAVLNDYSYRDDPLKKEDPDVTLSAEERAIGGLGIYMVKKTVDDISYVYRDGQNILSISKTI